MTMSRRSLVALALIAAASWLPRTADAFDGREFNEAEFAAFQAAGKSILIEAHAGWCPVCWKQAPIVTELLKKDDLKDYIRITVEYDMEKDVLRRFGIIKQSTMVVFKGKAETGRSIGDTNTASIEKLLRSAL